MALLKKLVGGGSKEKDLVIGAPQHFEKKTQETLDSLPQDLRKMLSISGINDDQRKKYPTQTVRALQVHAAIAEGLADAPARPTRSHKAQQARRDALAKAKSDKAMSNSAGARSPVVSRPPMSPRSASLPQMNDNEMPLEELVGSVLSEVDVQARYSGLSATPPLRSEAAMHGPESVRVRRVAVPAHAAGKAQLRSDLLVVQALGSHPHLAEYRTSYLVRNGTDETLWIVSDPVDGEPLSDILEDQGGSLGMGVIATILKAVLQLLEHVHSHDLVLQDLRVGGLFITADGSVQLVDMLPRPPGCFAYWLPPEAIITNQISAKGDIWSLGILAMELLEGKVPHSDITPAKAYLIIATEGRPPLRMPIATSDQKLLKDFIEKWCVCFKKNNNNNTGTNSFFCSTSKEPTDRASLKDLMAHPFLKLANNTADEMARLVRQLRGSRPERRPSAPARRVIQIEEWPTALLPVVAADLNVASQSSSVRDAIATASVQQVCASRIRDVLYSRWIVCV